jgi:cobalamin synthase
MGRTASRRRALALLTIGSVLVLVRPVLMLVVAIPVMAIVLLRGRCRRNKHGHRGDGT